MRNVFFFAGGLAASWIFVVVINAGTHRDFFVASPSFSIARERDLSAGRQNLFADTQKRRAGFPADAQNKGNEYESVPISAKSAILLEAKSGKILFTKAARARRPSASLAKLFTGIVAYENYNMWEVIPISDAAMAQNGSRFKTFRAGEAYTTEQLLNSALIESSNIAAYALAEHMGVDAFVARMNEKVKLLGFENTKFFGPTGRDEEGSYTTAWDIAKLGEYLLYNEDLAAILRKGSYDLYDAFGSFKRRIFTTNELWGIEGFVAAKTGYTDKAQGNLLFIMKHPRKPGEFLISVVMGSEDRARDTLRLIDRVR